MAAAKSRSALRQRSRSTGVLTARRGAGRARNARSARYARPWRGPGRARPPFPPHPLPPQTRGSVTRSVRSRLWAPAPPTRHAWLRTVAWSRRDGVPAPPPRRRAPVTSQPRSGLRLWLPRAPDGADVARRRGTARVPRRRLRPSAAHRPLRERLRSARLGGDRGVQEARRRGVIGRESREMLGVMPLPGSLPPQGPCLDTSA